MAIVILWSEMSVLPLLDCNTCLLAKERCVKSDNAVAVLLSGFVLHSSEICIRADHLKVSVKLDDERRTHQHMIWLIDFFHDSPFVESIMILGSQLTVAF